MQVCMNICANNVCVCGIYWLNPNREKAKNAGSESGVMLENISTATLNIDMGENWICNIRNECAYVHTCRDKWLFCCVFWAVLERKWVTDNFLELEQNKSMKNVCNFTICIFHFCSDYVCWYTRTRKIRAQVHFRYPYTSARFPEEVYCKKANTAHALYTNTNDSLRYRTHHHIGFGRVVSPQADSSAQVTMLDCITDSIGKWLQNHTITAAR